MNRSDSTPFHVIVFATFLNFHNNLIDRNRIANPEYLQTGRHRRTVGLFSSDGSMKSHDDKRADPACNGFSPAR